VGCIVTKHYKAAAGTTSSASSTSASTGCYGCIVSAKKKKQCSNVCMFKGKKSAQKLLLYKCLHLIKCGIHLGHTCSTLVSLRLHNSRTLATHLDSVHRLKQNYRLRRPLPRGRIAGCTCNVCVTQEVFFYVDGFLFEGFCFFPFTLFQFRGF
jgi:hypothetical protein